MSAILQRAKAHFAALPRHEMPIAEWGDDAGPAIVTWTEMTVRDQERIYAPNPDGTPATGGLVRLRAVMVKACDESGKRLFDDMSEHDLRYSVSGDIVGRIANQILYRSHLVDQAGATKPIEDQVDDAKNG